MKGKKLKTKKRFKGRHVQKMENGKGKILRMKGGQLFTASSKARNFTFQKANSKPRVLCTA